MLPYVSLLKSEINIDAFYLVYDYFFKNVKI
jgi:hypothetical protein